jgi:hypothetical protein
LLLRSAFSTMNPSWMDLLGRYKDNNELESRLPSDEEDELRQLRNMGIITHDGEWLFTPTRSKHIILTTRGNFLIALRICNDPKEHLPLAREIVDQLSKIGKDKELVGTLESLMRNPRINNQDDSTMTIMRRLRNMNLLGHSSYFLASAGSVFLTDLGFYVLGKALPE